MILLGIRLKKQQKVRQLDNEQEHPLRQYRNKPSTMNQQQEKFTRRPRRIWEAMKKSRSDVMIETRRGRQTFIEIPALVTKIKNVRIQHPHCALVLRTHTSVTT